MRAIFARFKKILVVELNYSDPPVGLMNETQPGRPSQLALLLRGRTQQHIDYWSITPGQPFSPGQIHDVVIDRLKEIDVIESRPGTERNTVRS